MLTETEEIQLGFIPSIPKGTPEESHNLKRLEAIYQDLLHKLEAWELELGEEFAIPEDDVSDIRVLSLNVEYPTLSVDVFTLIKLRLTFDEIKQGWMVSARHRDEASRV